MNCRLCAATETGIRPPLCADTPTTRIFNKPECEAILRARQLRN
jgi:hypothetical protein